MIHASSFQFSAQVAASGASFHLDGQFSAVDRVHYVLRGSNGPAVEVAFIGRRAFRKDPGTGKWLTVAMPSGGVQSGTSLATDPRLVFSVLLRAESVTRVGPAYHFTLKGQAGRRLNEAANRIDGTATVSGGTIAMLSYQGDDPHHTAVEVTYSEVNSAPPVTAPVPG
jgi:hypothetical protein